MILYFPFLVQNVQMLYRRASSFREIVFLYHNILNLQTSLNGNTLQCGVTMGDGPEKFEDLKKRTFFKIIRLNLRYNLLTNMSKKIF